MQNFNGTNTKELSFKKHKEHYPPFLKTLPVTTSFKDHHF